MKTCETQWQTCKSHEQLMKNIGNHETHMKNNETPAKIMKHLWKTNEHRWQFPLLFLVPAPIWSRSGPKTEPLNRTIPTTLSACCLKLKRPILHAQVTAKASLCILLWFSMGHVFPRFSWCSIVFNSIAFVFNGF